MTMFTRHNFKFSLRSITSIGLTFFILSADLALSAEVDSWTKRERTLRRSEDKALGMINKFTNLRFKEALDEVNKLGRQKGRSCDQKDLYDYVYSKLGGFMTGEVETYIKNSKKLANERSCTKFKQSVYRDFSIVEGTGLVMAEGALGCVVNINGSVVGSDKFGHFFGQGYTYFKMTELDHGKEKDVLKYGDFTEKTYFGLQTTGVYSYGDLAANYEGMKFWRRLTPQYNTHGDGPSYVSCRDGKWAMNMDFDWSEYVSPAWDEGTNCNYYRGEKMTDKLNSNLEKKGYTCPAREKDCRKIIERYGSNPEVSKGIISPACPLSLKEKNISVPDEDFQSKEEDLDDASNNVRGLRGVCSTAYDITGIFGGLLFGKRVDKIMKMQTEEE